MYYVSSANLRLITNDVDAPWVHKSDDTIWVVTWQELCGHRQAVHIHWDWRAGHLKKGTKHVENTTLGTKIFREQKGGLEHKEVISDCLPQASQESTLRRLYDRGVKNYSNYLQRDQLYSQSVNSLKLQVDSMNREKQWD